jgi:6-phosphogluconolactonase/glucosamine-6-phosphate isomerase/deaminase
VQVFVSPDPSVAAAARIAYRLRDAVRRRGEASLALSGGSTAPPMIAALVGSDLPWAAVTIWQVDERVAPDGHPDRNARQLAPFADVGCRVRLMPVTSTDLGAAARRYGRGLPDRFDVAHLGVGDDGHTASWPPDEPDVWSSTRPVENVASFHGRRRMTLTPPVVNAARARVVLTTGASKRPMIERWLAGDRSLPITAVRRGSTWVYLDDAAAPAGVLG